MERTHCCQKCGYSEPSALCQRNGETLCYECLLLADGRIPTELHHVLGRKNAEDVIRIAGNLHRYLSARQRRWPKSLNANVRRDPILTLAALLLSVVDLASYLAQHLERFAYWLLALRGWLVERFGEGWWEKSDLPPVWRKNG